MKYPTINKTKLDSINKKRFDNLEDEITGSIVFDNKENELGLSEYKKFPRGVIKRVVERRVEKYLGKPSRQKTGEQKVKLDCLIYDLTEYFYKKINRRIKTNL